MQVCVPKGFESLCFDIDVRFIGSIWAERVYGSRIYKNAKTKRLSVEGGESRPGRLDTPAAPGYFKAGGRSRRTFRDANCAHLSFSFALPVLSRRALSGRTKPTSGRLAITTEVRIPQFAAIVKGRFGGIFCPDTQTRRLALILSFPDFIVLL